MRRQLRSVKRPLIRSARLWVPTGIVVLLIVGGGLLALDIVPKGLAVKSELEAALPLASRVQAEIIAGDSEAASATTAELKGHTENARAEARGRAWSVLEKFPFIGANLEALRVVAETVDDLAEDALVPASAISIDSLKPVNGQFDVIALTELGGLLSTTIASVDKATERLDGLQQGALVPQMSAGVGKLASALDEARPILASLEEPLSILPGALGSSGPRNYLMIFQGNSEVRASGGNPASMVLLTVSDGIVTIARQATSTDFESARKDPVAPIDAETEAIYSDIVGRWTPNVTAMPHFPTTVGLISAYWAEEFDEELDGIISFDPVGLSYLLGATGPVTLATGDTLTSENAVPLLLNEVYFRYPDGADSNAFFAAAAASIFDTVKSGSGEPASLIGAITKSVNEGRLKMWSAHAEEQELIAGTKLEGVLPDKNTEQTALGVYFNDTTGSKMDYYVDAAVSASTTQCEAIGENPKFTADVTLTNSVTREMAGGLPRYITGPYYEAGFIATDFVVYGPVGATIDSWLVNGKEQAAVTQGTHLGRPVVRLNYVLAPGASVVISYKMTGVAESEYGPLEVQTTPMVRATPVTIDAPGCKEK